MKLSLFSKCIFLLVFVVIQNPGALFSQCPNYSVSVFSSNDSRTVCPWGFPTSLNAQLMQGATNISGATYTWNPGNIIGQSTIVNPTITTIYTVTVKQAACVYSSVVTVSVMAIVAPSITYSPTPYASTVTATFPVTLTGISGGTYAIAPSNPSVTINSTSGLITAWGSSSGTYTVTYHKTPFSAEGGFCEDIYATAIVILQNLDCPFTIPVNSFTLCPDDKVVFTSTVTFPNGSTGTATSLYWSPVTDLSCTSCISPTLAYTGVATIYTVTGIYNRAVCGSATVSVKKKEFCEKDDIIGCCFSNYGAAVTLANATTYLNIYCNLVNELGNTPTSTLALQKGEFQNNKGTVRVLLDLIHNAKNNLYTVTDGTTSAFGADQKIKGNSSTYFFELWLNGNGTKSIWIDEYANSTLDLTSNILSTQNFMFSMKNPTVNVIRTTGYVTTGVNGYFSWLIQPTAFLLAASQKYLFALGGQANATAPFRYRPLVMANNAFLIQDEISANFMNKLPSLATDPIFINANTTLTNVVTNQAPNVLQINNAFYHKIKNTVATPTVISDLSIKSYYFSSDGQFQSLAEWEKDPAQTLEWWGSTPGANNSNTLSVDPGTPGMIYAMTTGTLNFNNKPFALSRGGFYLNTNNFGNVGGSGTMFSITSVTPGGGSPAPSGGGLGNPYGTGSSSGNSGGGGNTIFTPNPVAGEYIMTVTPANTCAIGGNIRFVIDQNGNIAPSSVKYGISPGSYLGELSDAVYTIDNVNSGITFSASPRDILKNCVNSATVTTSLDGNYVLNSGESISVSLPSASSSSNTITYGQFKLFSKSNIQVYTSGVLSAGNTLLTPSLAADVYRFELLVTASTVPPTSETIRGQIIVK